MIQHIEAIYDHGVLKPLGALDLEDQEVVSISIEKRSEMERDSNKVRKTLFESMNEAGLIGCIKDGPPDLSTNPKYMEGFGRNGK